MAKYGILQGRNITITSSNNHRKQNVTVNVSQDANFICMVDGIQGELCMLLNQLMVSIIVQET